MTMERQVSRPLTSITVAKAQPPQRGEPQRVVWDGGSGLGLRVNHDSRSWIVQARAPDGKSVRRTLGSADGPDALTLAQARKAAIRAKVAIESGDVPAPQRQRVQQATTPTGALTFSRAREQYIAAIKDVHAASYLKSWQSVAGLLNRDEFTDWEQRPLASITRADVKALFLAMTANIAARAEGKQHVPGMLRRGVGVTSNRALSAISSLWEWVAQLHEIDGENPARNWSSLRRAEQGREVRIALADVGRIYRAFDAAPYPWNVAYKLTMLTGARRGEIQGLLRSELHDLGTGAARIEKGSNSKAGVKLNRVIPLVPAAAALILGAEARAPYVWSFDAPLKDDWRVDTMVRKAAGLAYAWQVHGLRHVLTDFLASRDVPLEVVQACLGHSTGSGALRHYISARGLGGHRQALQLWADFVAEASKLG